MFVACGPSKAEIEEKTIREAQYNKIMEEKAEKERQAETDSMKLSKVEF